jgi:hypothetical protein
MAATCAEPTLRSISSWATRPRAVALAGTVALAEVDVILDEADTVFTDASYFDDALGALSRCSPLRLPATRSSPTNAARPSSNAAEPTTS